MQRFLTTDGNRKRGVSLLTCLHTTTFILLIVFPLVEKNSSKSGGGHCPGVRNVHLRLPSVAQKSLVL